MRITSRRRLGRVLIRLLGVATLGAGVFSWPSVCAADVVQLIADLDGTDAAVADSAYAQLFALEDQAIDALLNNTSTAGSYAGAAWANPNSSSIILVDDPPPTIGIISLYLVEAILLDRPTPHLLPQLTSTTLSDSAVFSAAVSAYLNWWTSHQGEPMWQLRTDPPPLDPTDIIWH